jgi:hypothetical protein
VEAELLLTVAAVVEGRMAVAAADVRTAAEVVDMLVAAEAAMQVVVTPEVTANDRDEDLDVSDKLCH